MAKFYVENAKSKKTERDYLVLGAETADGKKYHLTYNVEVICDVLDCSPSQLRTIVGKEYID